jgi:eukaryotic-like serine/threonine-protein kinase
VAKYETAVPLGRGAMGEVFKAFDPVLQRFVALKYLRWGDEAMAERLLREARLQARVDHESVCKVYDVGVDQGRPFIAMQYIEGRSLEELAPELSLAEKLEIVSAVADAVEAAHQTGLIHRDLKPQNILLERRAAGGYKPYVLDFGLAREHEAPGLTETGMILGTPAYMAPEQALGRLDCLDRRTDVHALGAVLYRLVTGRPPFQGSDLDVAMRVAYTDVPPPRTLTPELPFELEAIILTCLAKEPARRYDTARALAEDLRRLQTGQRVSARAPGWSERAWRRTRRNPKTAAAAALGVLSVAALGAYAFKGSWDDRERAAAALRLGQEVAQIEGSLRQASLLPLHDTRPERRRVLERMQAMERELAGMGAAAEGPGRYALGRAHLALHRYEDAQAELERAWKAGYRTPEVAQALGQALGARYQRSLERAQRIPVRALRERRAAEMDKAFREPAFAYLQTAGNAATLPPYIAALSAFYAKRYDEAVEKAQHAYQQAPGLYEARVLEGDVIRLQAQQKAAAGEYAPALAGLEAALALYARAAEVARSDALVYQRQCECGMSMSETRWRSGQKYDDIFAVARRACQAALTADPDHGETHTTLSVLYFRRGEDRSLRDEERFRYLDEAQAAAEQAVRADPRDVDAYRTIGAVAVVRAEEELEHSRDPRPMLNAAIAANETALRIDPGRADFYHGLGLAHLRLGQYDREWGRDPRRSYGRSVEMHRKAVEITPSPTNYNTLGITYKEASLYEREQGGDPNPLLDQAVAAYREGLASNPRHYFSQVNLGNALVHKADWERYSGRDPSALLVQAREALQAAGAINAKQGAQDLFLGNAEVVAARWSASQGRSPEAELAAAGAAYQRALAVLAELSELHRSLAELYRWRAEWRVRAGQPPAEEVRRGLAAIRQALALAPDDGRTLAVEGVLLALAARQVQEPAARSRALAEAAVPLRRAIEKNKLLAREFGADLAALEPPAASAGARP